MHSYYYSSRYKIPDKNLYRCFDKNMSMLHRNPLYNHLNMIQYNDRNMSLSMSNYIHIGNIRLRIQPPLRLRAHLKEELLRGLVAHSLLPF